MAKSNKKKARANKKRGKKHATSPISEEIKATWAGKSPVLLYILFLGVFMAVFYLVWSTSFFTENILSKIVGLYAYLGSGVLNILGMGTSANAGNIVSPEFSISVKKGCDALEPMALFSAAVIAFPVKAFLKWPALIKGLAFLFVLNVIRIVSLFWIGKYFPDLFYIMHIEVWQALFFLAAVLLWIFWIQKKVVGSKSEMAEV